MNHAKRLLLFSALITLAACGGGGGGGGDGGGSAAPVARNLAPTVSTETLVLGGSGQTVTLTATASDPEGDTLTYSWTQTRGAAVTDQQNFNTATMSFRHTGGGLSDVETIGFTVHVSDGTVSKSATTDVIIAKDATRAVFVDGIDGSDSTGDGSLAAPYASIDFAIDNAAMSDVYVRSLAGAAAYDIDRSAITLTDGTSIYGGFDGNWIRDIVDNKTVVRVGASGLRLLSSNAAVEVSGLDLTATSPTGYSTSDVHEDPIDVRALYADTANSDLVITHNIFESETAVPVSGFNHGGSSKAVQIVAASTLMFEDNVVIAGDGNESIATPNPGGYSSSPVHDGGSGGAGGNESNENGGTGGHGGASISGSCGRGGSGGSGNGSEGGHGANGGNGCRYNLYTNGTGGAGYGALSGRATRPGIGRSLAGAGSAGANGGGGGGGGGGEAASGIGLDGGFGGTGGRGGRGGASSPGSYGGGASIGIELVQTTSASITNNSVLTANGGKGGDSSGRNAGEAGVRGTSGSSGKDGVFNDGGDGGDGGDGAEGGFSGIGGAGGGGPSFAIVLEDVGSLTISGNALETGSGGDGGVPYIPPREPIGTPVTHGKGGWSAGIFHWDPALDLGGVSNNSFTLGTAGPGGRSNSDLGTGVSAEIANPDTPLPFN